MSLLLLGGGAPSSFIPEPIATPGAYDPLLDLTLYLEVSTANSLDLVQTWLDLSPYLMAQVGGLNGAIQIDRGRDSETDRFKSASMTWWLDNSTRAFDTTNTASPYYACLRARRQVRLRVHAGPNAAPSSAVFTLFRGFVRGWPRRYGEGNQFSWVQMQANDGFRIAEQSNLTEGTFTLDDDVLGLLDVGRLGGTELDVELSGARIEALADAFGWPSDLRSIDPGVVEVGEQETRTGGDALTQVEAAEDGYVYFDNDGTLIFLPRLAAWEDARLTTSDVTIGPGGDIGYVDIDGVGIDDSRIRNDVRRSGASGVEQSATDIASVREYGWATDGPETLIAVNDGDVAGIVQTRIRRLAQPVERITTITLDVIDADLLAEVMERRVLDRITVNAHPPGGDAYDPSEVLVQGIQHTITNAGWTATYRLAPTPTEDLFTLDDDALGLLDSEALLAP